MNSILLISILANSPSADPSYPHPKLLVEVPDLAKPGEKKIRILDARPKELYLAGHVPGAVWVNAADWSKAVNDKPAGWDMRLAEVGLTPEMTAVVYAVDVRDSARVWWILKFAGVEDARILNGGWTAWEAGKQSVEKTANVPKVDASKWTARRERLATKDDLLGFIKAKNAQIVDARSNDEFCGTAQTAKRNGHIPGAVRLEWSDLLDDTSKRFKSPEQLKALFAERKIDPTKPAVTYCQSGGRAAVMAFGLELMGGKTPRNYYRSWSEWGNLPDTPIEITPKKSPGDTPPKK